MKKIFLGLSILGGVMLFSQCKFDSDDFKGPDEAIVSPSLNVPLTSGDLNITSLLTEEDRKLVKTFTATDQEVLDGRASVGDFYFQYKDSTEQNFGEAFNLAPINFSFQIPGSSAAPIPVGAPEQTVSVSEDIPLQLINGADLNTIIAAVSSLSLNVNNNSRLSYTYTFTLPGVTKSDGTTLSFGGVTGGSNPSTFTSNQNLNGATFDLTKGGTTTNTLEVNVEVRINNDTSSPQTLSNAAINVDFSFTGFDRIEGVFDTIVLSPADPINTTINPFTDDFIDKNNVEFKFGDVSIDLKIENPTTTEFGVAFTQLNVNKAGAAPLRVLTNPLNNITIPAATTIGNPSSINVAVTNGTAIINYEPEEFNLAQVTTINPSGRPATGTLNIIRGSDKIKSVATIRVPIYGSLKGLQLNERFKSSPQEVNEIDLKSAQLFVEISNSYPIEGSLILNVLNTANVVTKTIFIDSTDPNCNKTSKNGSCTLVPAAQVDASGNVTTPGTISTNLPITEEEVKSLLEAERLGLRVDLATTDNGATLVRFNESQKITVKLAITIDGKVTYKI